MRNICVFTGSRAEYGLLMPLMDAIKKDKAMILKVLVSGMHLAPEFGLTYREIEQDGFPINERVEMLVSSDTTEGTAASIGLGVAGIAKALVRLSPDIIVVLGDRFEALACAVAATTVRVPVAHIHGGEVTEGALDEAYRHSITKMSFLHFTSTEEYRKRVIQLGENPDRVFSVGALGIDNIKKMKLLSKASLEKSLGITFGKRTLMVTFHPATAEDDTARRQLLNLLAALDELTETRLIFTKANADAGGRVINTLIDRYVAKNSNKAVVFTSLGQLRYLSLLRFVDAVVGNSSSGIVEAPSFKIGTINIGDRQKGRIRPPSVIDCSPTKTGIIHALKRLYSPEFGAVLKTFVNPYGNGRAADQIKRFLKSIPTPHSMKKPFYNIDFQVKESYE